MSQKSRAARKLQEVDLHQCTKLAAFLAFETRNKKRALGAAKTTNKEGEGILVCVPKASFEHTNSKSVQALGLRYSVCHINQGMCLDCAETA